MMNNNATWADFESMDAETLASVMNAITTDSTGTATDEEFGFGMDSFLMRQQQAHALYACQFKKASGATDTATTATTTKAAAASATTTTDASVSSAFPSMYQVEQQPDPNQFSHQQQQSNHSRGTVTKWEFASQEQKDAATAVIRSMNNSSSTSRSSGHRSHPTNNNNNNNTSTAAERRSQSSSKGGSSLASSSTPSTTTTTAATTNSATASAMSPREMKRHIEKSHKRRLREKPTTTTSTTTTTTTTNTSRALHTSGHGTDAPPVVPTSGTAFWDGDMFQRNVPHSSTVMDASTHVGDVDTINKDKQRPISGGGSSSILAFTHEPSSSSFFGPTAPENDSLHTRTRNVPQAQPSSIGSMDASCDDFNDADSNHDKQGPISGGGSSSILAFTHEPPTVKSSFSFVPAENDTIHTVNVPQSMAVSSYDFDVDSKDYEQRSISGGSSSILAFTHEPSIVKSSSVFGAESDTRRNDTGDADDDAPPSRETVPSKSRLEESLTSLPDWAHLFSAFHDTDEQQPTQHHHHHKHHQKHHHKHANKKKKSSAPNRHKQPLQDPSLTDTNVTSASIQTAVMSGSKKQMHFETRTKQQKKQRKERVDNRSSKTINSKLSTRSLPVGMVVCATSTNDDSVDNLHSSAPIRMEPDNSWANFDHVEPPPSSRDDIGVLSQHHHQQRSNVQPPSPPRPHRIHSLPIVLRTGPIHSPSVATIASDPYHSLDRHGGTGAQLKFCMIPAEQQSPPKQDEVREQKQEDSKSTWMMESNRSEEWSKGKRDTSADLERPDTFDSYYKKPVHPKVEQQDNAYWLSYRNNENRPKCWKSKWMIGGFVIALLVCGIGVGLYLGLRPNQNSSTTNGSSSSNGDCSVDDIPQQCTLVGRISTFPTCVKSRYDELKVNFLPNLNPNFDADEDSCASGNVALINLATTTTGDESVKELESMYLLSVLFYATEGQTWFNSNLWASDGPYCSWWGVLCNENLDVIELNLESNNLVGTLPTELGLLSTLQNLTLADNAIGSTIPSEIGMLSSLVSVDAHGNLLEGSLPLEIGRLGALDRMNFSFNKLRGSIPATIGDMKNLVNIYLNNNVLVGQIPSEIQYCRNLLSIIVDSNALSGTIPSELGALLSIETMELANNLFSDTTIPSELGLLSTLTSLNMDGSNIVGTIPSELGNLSSLSVLQLGSSTLSGTIPTELGQLGRLVSLNLNLNRLTGALPSEFGALYQLTQLDLSYNRMTGTLPTELGLLTNLSVLMVGGNFFVGQVPSQVCSLWDANLDVFIGDYCSGEYLNCTADPTCCPAC